jgi:hypothetical protein
LTRFSKETVFLIMTIATADTDVRNIIEHLRYAANAPMVAAHRGLRWSGVPENVGAFFTKMLMTEQSSFVLCCRKRYLAG